MPHVVIVGAVRSAIGTYGGALRDVRPVTLGGQIVSASLSQAGMAPADVDEVILGMIYQGGQGPNPARQAAVHAGLPYSVPAMTVKNPAPRAWFPMSSRMLGKCLTSLASVSSHSTA